MRLAENKMQYRIIFIKSDNQSLAHFEQTDDHGKWVHCETLESDAFYDFETAGAALRELGLRRELTVWLELDRPQSSGEDEGAAPA